MKFSQEYVNSQITQSKLTIEKHRNTIDREREFLADFLISQGYKKIKNFYVHPAYVEDWKQRKDGYFGDYPEGTVFPCP